MPLFHLNFAHDLSASKVLSLMLELFKACHNQINHFTRFSSTATIRSVAHRLVSLSNKLDTMNHPPETNSTTKQHASSTSARVDATLDSSNSNRSTLNQSTSPSQRPKEKSRRFGRALVGLLLLTILVAIGVIYVRSLVSAPTGPQLTHTVTRGDLNVTVVEKGLLESSNNTEIKCKVRGYSVVTWVVPGGTHVEPGDELIRLDTKRIEDAIGKNTTDAHVARATYERTKADVARAEIAIDAYLEGTYRSQLKVLKKQLAFAESNLASVEKSLGHSEAMFRRGYVSRFELQAARLAVNQAKLELKVRQTAIDVLNSYTKEMETETLRGNLRALKSKLKADEAGLALDEGRRDRAIEELEYCVIKSESSGIVIFPSAAAWKNTPDVAEGANVRKDQVLLLMPDLTQMQVKIGIHESLVDRIKKGMPAKITLPDATIDGEVKMVALVARPAGWWTGNVVKYDAIIDLPSAEGLKPGMSAQVEVIMAKYKDVLTVPVSAVVETKDRKLCWVKTATGTERRLLKLGDSNDIFIIVESGLKEGDQVILNPLQIIEDAKGEALRTFEQSNSTVKETAVGSDSKEDLIGTTSEERTRD